ncbi:hypothetical protein H4K36_00395 [Streptomyces sp. DHE7-1]|nr:hypothetical protein [Streptomyces sp. DHE7-1]
MNTKLRLAAATATAAIALGVAAPLANASEAARPAAVASVQTQAVTDAGAVNAFTTSARTVAARDAGLQGTTSDQDLRDVAKYIVQFLKTKATGDYLKAKAAAKKGYAAFVKWVKSLKPSNPVRIVLEFGGKKLISIVISLLK